MKLSGHEIAEEKEETEALIMLLKLSEESLNDERLILDEAFDIN